MQLADSTDRDLSAWRVSIPSVKTKFDANNKSYSVFYIDVQKDNGMKDGTYVVSSGILFCLCLEALF